MMRVHFTPEDLSRVSVAPMAGPMAETLLALGALTDPVPRPEMRTWRRSALPRLGRPAADLVKVVHPHPGVTLDLFTLSGSGDSLDDAASRLLDAPDASLHQELGAVCGPPVPRWLRGLPDGQPAARRRLVDALREGHTQVVEPYWVAIARLLDRHHERLVRALADGGVCGLMGCLQPGARWRHPVLELPAAAAWSRDDLDAALGGRGLVVAPSVFSRTPTPYFPIDTTQPAVLLTPVGVASPRWWRRDAPAPRQLDKLLGRTRAAALDAIVRTDGGCTTTELGRLIQVSPATASEQARVLRESGLIDSTRDANRMLHTVTPLGRTLNARTGQ